MKKIFTLLLFVLVTSLILPQNSGNLSGTVTDALTGDALPGVNVIIKGTYFGTCLLYTSPSPRDRTRSRMPSSA